MYKKSAKKLNRNEKYITCVYRLGDECHYGVEESTLCNGVFNERCDGYEFVYPRFILEFKKQSMGLKIYYFD